MIFFQENVVNQIYYLCLTSEHGISGQLLLWIKYFLLKRRQQVCVTSALSDWASIITCVSQMSVLVLFYLYYL